MYKIFKESYETGIKVNQEFSRKTAELVREHTKGEDILEAIRTYKINEHTLQKIEESTVSEIEKVFNLVTSIIIEIRLRLMHAPYLIPIGERAENIHFPLVKFFLTKQVLGYAILKKEKVNSTGNLL